MPNGTAKVGQSWHRPCCPLWEIESPRAIRLHLHECQSSTCDASRRSYTREFISRGVLFRNPSKALIYVFCSILCRLRCRKAFLCCESSAVYRRSLAAGYEAYNRKTLCPCRSCLSYVNVVCINDKIIRDVCCKNKISRTVDSRRPEAAFGERSFSSRRTMPRLSHKHGIEILIKNASVVFNFVMIPVDDSNFRYNKKCNSFLQISISCY